MIFVKAYSKWHFKLLKDDFQKIFHENIASNRYRRQKSLMRFLTRIYLIFLSDRVLGSMGRYGMLFIIRFWISIRAYHVC